MIEKIISTLKSQVPVIVVAIEIALSWPAWSDDHGTLTGFVQFPGETPPAAMIVNRDEARCPHGIAQNFLQVHQESRGLQNVLIVIEIPDSVEPKAVPAQLVFDQCTLSPRFQSVVHGTSLTVINRDDTSHGIEVTQDGDTIFEAELPPHSRPLRRPMMHAGLHKVNCADHLWERAWIYVSPNPYAVITDDKGRFSIPDVPLGRYVVRAWHEGWTEKGHDPDGRIEYQPMQQELKVTISAGKTKDIRFDDLQPTF